MALQSSGAISISQIKGEVGGSSSSLRSLSNTASKSAPDGMQEFYGYSGAPSYDYNSNMQVGSGSYYSSTAYGYANNSSIHVFGTFGFLYPATFNSSSFEGLYHQGNFIYFYFTISKPSWTSLVINGTNFGASSGWTRVNTKLWRYSTSSNPCGTSGG
ncbi:MAG: hypothetical protein ACKVJK_12705, partial [Methylophagaceae bacterium]